MKYSVSLFCSGLMLLAGLVTSGCGPYGQSRLDEEKESHFLAGKSCVSRMDYKGAIEAFEKALQANPHSASAHFELACLFERKEVADPAAAIYHYEQYLKLRPDADLADLAKQHVMSCEQELARKVYLGPLTPKLERQLEQVTDENKRLTDENKRLREDLDKWNAYAARLQAATNRAGLNPPVTRGGQPAGSGQPGPPVGSVSNATSRGTSPVTVGPRTYKVQANDNPEKIAKMFGIKVQALMAANPKLDPLRLQIGQTLNIPLPSP
jgi:tetratricopeptide (TPR) repeat protein